MLAALYSVPTCQDLPHSKLCVPIFGPESVIVAISAPPKDSDEKEHLSGLQL